MFWIYKSKFFFIKLTLKIEKTVLKICGFSDDNQIKILID